MRSCSSPRASSQERRRLRIWVHHRNIHHCAGIPNIISNSANNQLYRYLMISLFVSWIFYKDLRLAF